MTLETQISPSIAQNASPAKTEEAQSWFLSTVQLWGLVVLTLHLAASSLPAETAWSVWPYTFLPPWLGWLLALLVAALIIPAFNNIALKGLEWLWSAWPGKRAHHVWFALAALLAGLLFWLARLRHLRWGDAYVLTVALAYDGPGGPLIYNWQAPLTIFANQRLWQFVANPLFGWSPEDVYAAVSIICGMIFVYALLTFLSQLERSPLETTVLAGLMLTTGSMQLFFGYVENYTVVSLGLLMTMFLAWRALRGEAQPVWPVLALSLTNGFHPSTVFLWPGMLFLVWQCWKRQHVSLTAGLLQTILPPLLVGGGVFALMEHGGHGLSALLGADRPGGGDAIWFVPLLATTTQWQHYTMFSAAHVLDWSNEHLLISPFGLPLILLSLITIYRFRLNLFDPSKIDPSKIDPSKFDPSKFDPSKFDPSIFDASSDKDYGHFLGVTAAAYLLLTWLWNPDYGGHKDWDLFAPSAFVYTLLAGYLLVRVLSDRDKLKAGGLFVIAVSLLHTTAWIFTNTHELPRE